jgi:hypothetical protein
MKYLLTRIFIVLFSSFISFIICLYLLSLYLGNFKSINIKYLLNSSNPYFFDYKDNFIKFKPYSGYSIKSVLNDSGNLSDIFSYSFLTNNYGYVQNKDLVDNKDSFIFIGDSFTQGFGTESWVDKINIHNKPNLQIINAGMMSTGFIDWKYHLKYLKSTFKVKHIAIFFISDDLYRKQFIPSNEVLECIKFSRSCSSRSSYVGVNYYNFTDTTSNSMLKDKIVNTFQVLIFNSFIKAHRYSQNTSAISNIIQVNDDANLTFFHIPMYDEIVNNSYHHKAKSTQLLLEERGVTYVPLLLTCDLTPKDYIKFDGHLNIIGNEKLLKCVEKSIKNKLESLN